MFGDGRFFDFATPNSVASCLCLKDWWCFMSCLGDPGVTYLSQKKKKKKKTAARVNFWVS